MIRYALSPAAIERGEVEKEFDPESLAHVYTYGGPNGALDTDTCTDGRKTFVKTYTYTDGKLAGESMWVKQ